MLNDFINPTMRLHPYPGKLSRALHYLRFKNIMVTDQGSEFHYRSAASGRTILGDIARRKIQNEGWE